MKKSEKTAAAIMIFLCFSFCTFFAILISKILLILFTLLLTLDLKPIFMNDDFEDYEDMTIQINIIDEPESKIISVAKPISPPEPLMLPRYKMESKWVSENDLDCHSQFIPMKGWTCLND